MCWDSRLEPRLEMRGNSSLTVQNVALQETQTHDLSRVKQRYYPLSHEPLEVNEIVG